MKQKRKVKSLLPKKNFVNGRFLTILLVVLSLVLCVWWVSLLTNSVWAGNNDWVKIVVYHHYSYLSWSSCDVVAGKGDKYLYATGDSIEINLDELLLSKGYLFSHLTYDTYSWQNRLYDVKSDNNIVHVYYDADAQQDVNGNNVPDSQEKQDLTINYLYKRLSWHAISWSEKIKLLFNENYTVTGKSLNCYYFEPEFITGVKLCGAETAKFYYTAKWECDQNNDGVSDDEENIVTIHHVYTWWKLIATEHYLVISWQAFISYNYYGNLWHNTVNNQHYDRQPKSITDGDVTGDRQYTFIYYPNHDCNQNGIADEEETRQIKIDYSCKICKKDPYQCNIPSYEGVYELNKSFDTPIPQVPWYRNVVPDKSVIEWSCEDQQIGVVLTLSEPEKDQNNDGIWDGEQELWEITEFDYTWLDNRVEVLYGMRFLDPSDFTKIVNSIYMSGSSLYISPNPVIVNGSSNTVDTGVYSHILWWADNEVYSNNITLIAWSNNKIHAWNDNASVLWWNGNEVMSWKSGWIPTILVGWESNVMGTGHDGNALIWWKGNNIEEGHSNVFILWWENNIILWKDDWFDTPSKNAIIWWKNVKLVGFDDVFVYSNIDGRFSPASHKAFYLNVGGGVWISTGWIEWLSVGGAVSIWRVNINNTLCDNSSLWVIWSYSGCLVWCTKASVNDGWKWEMLDQGNECAKICQNNSGHCLNQDDEVVNVEDSRAQCTTWVVNTDNAHLCIDDLDSYKNVIFESSLIDSEKRCPVGQNVCVYQCDEGYHLTWDRTTWKIGCYSDCKLPWDSTTSIRHNETVVGYNIEDVSCSNDIYVFPLETEIINTWQPGPTYQKWNIKRGTITYKNRAKYGTSYESCGNYDHKKTLICNNWVLELINNKWKPISGSSELAQEYKYDSCNLYNYRCDTSKYTLTSGQIEAEKNDGPMNNGSREVADRGILTWRRWLYEACIDFDANPTNPTNNWETCSKKTYHYYFSGCKDGYVLGDDGICRKDCSLIDKDWNLIGYHNNAVVTWYQVASTQCPDECTWSKLVCDDGLWHIGSKTGAVADGTWYNYCNWGKKTCGSEFNVNQSEHDTWVSTSFYSNCVNYSVSSNICTTGATVYKLTWCIENYHANETMKWCVSNTGYSQCYEGFKPDNSDYVIVNVPITWNGSWNTGNWTEPEDCKWACNGGYVTGSDGKSCVLAECWEEVNTCKNGISATWIWNDASGSWWKCGSKTCSLCNDGYHPVGSGDTPPYCEKNVNGKCGSGHYNCAPWNMKNDRNEWLSWWIAYSWDCLGVGSWTTNDLWCVECSNWYLQDGKICKKIENGECDIEHYNCKKWFSVNTGENDTEYYWDCDGENWWELQEWCKECKEWFHMNDDRECVDDDIYEICIYSEKAGDEVGVDKIKFRTVDLRPLPYDWYITIKWLYPLKFKQTCTLPAWQTCTSPTVTNVVRYVISWWNNFSVIDRSSVSYSPEPSRHSCCKYDYNLPEVNWKYLSTGYGDTWWISDLPSYPNFHYVGVCPEQKQMPDNWCFQWMDDFLYYWDESSTPVRLNKIDGWLDPDSVGYPSYEHDEPWSPYPGYYLMDQNVASFEEYLWTLPLDIDLNAYSSEIFVDNIYIPCYYNPGDAHDMWCKLRMSRYNHQWRILEVEYAWDTVWYCTDKGY